jgi:hypothetical protein
MTPKTYSDLVLFVQNKLDIRDEDFIDSTELLQYTEEALLYCEAEIHKLNIEDQYFVAHDVVPLVYGQDMYNLPSNIYGNKILRIVYSDGSSICNIPRRTQKERFADSVYDTTIAPTVNGQYSYMLTNLGQLNGNRMRFYPKPQEASDTVTVAGGVTTVGSTAMTSAAAFTSSSIQPGWFVTAGSSVYPGTRVQEVVSTSAVTLTEKAALTSTALSVTFTEPLVQIWYIRQVAIPTGSTTLTEYIDFPEFWYFIAQHVVVNCLKKEIGNPRLDVELATLNELKMQMTNTLSNMVPDQDDEIEKDLTMYADQGVVY